MTPDDNEQANAALLFELDQKIEQRIEAALRKLLKMPAYAPESLTSELKFLIGHALLDDRTFMKAVTEEVLSISHRQFNSSIPTHRQTYW